MWGGHPDSIQSTQPGFPGLQLLWHKVHPFKGCDSMAFSSVTELCSYHPNLGHFHLPEPSSCYRFFPTLPVPSQTLETTEPRSVSKDLPVLTFLIRGAVRPSRTATMEE